MSYRDRMLKMMTRKPCEVRSFTEGATTLSVPVRHVEAWISDLQAQGLIERFGESFYVATEAGVAHVTRPAEIAQARTHCSASQPVWVPTKWTSSRPGADDHRQFKSLGI